MSFSGELKSLTFKKLSSQPIS